MLISSRFLFDATGIYFFNTANFSFSHKIFDNSQKYF